MRGKVGSKYTIGKVLKCKYQKGLIFSIWSFKFKVMAKSKIWSQICNLTPNHSKPKKKAKWHPNWTFDVALELLSKGYNFAFISFSIKTCIQELWTHKIMGFIPWIKLGIFWIPWEFETWEFSYHFDAMPTIVMEYVTWKEVVAFLQVWAMACLLCVSCLSFICASILAPIYTINPFLWFVQVDVTLNSHLWIHPNPILEVPSSFISWELKCALWVCIPLQTWELIGYVTLNKTSQTYKCIIVPHLHYHYNLVKSCT